MKVNGEVVSTENAAMIPKFPPPIRDYPFSFFSV